MRIKLEKRIQKNKLLTEIPGGCKIEADTDHAVNGSYVHALFTNIHKTIGLYRSCHEIEHCESCSWNSYENESHATHIKYTLGARNLEWM